MIWLFLLIAIGLLACLGALEYFELSPVVQYWLLSDASGYLTNALLLSLLLLCLGWRWFFTDKRQDQPKASALFFKTALSPNLLIFIVVFLLFITRALMSYAQYESQSPKNRLMVVATASIEEISDGIEDEINGTHYRQVARLNHVRIGELKRQPKHALLTLNPFLSDTSLQKQDDPSLAPSELASLENMRVLLSINRTLDKQSIDKLNRLPPNSQIQVQLLIAPINRQKTASGFDVEQWLKTRHIHANAAIVQLGEITQSPPARLWSRLQSWRWQLRTHFYQDWQQLTKEQQQAKAVSLSLLTGDRALIDKQTKQLYMLAGISHLLAISGTHVLFLAMILSAILLGFIDRLYPMMYQRVTKWQLRLCVMVAASFVYAMFTGFEVPAMRTVFMLLAMLLARSLVLPISQLSVLICVALVMVWLDPYVLWQAGFWLSFIAVLLLMRYGLDEATIASHFGLVAEQSRVQSVWQKFRQMTALQFWLFFMMLPITILLFKKVSLWGLLINLFAIGFFGVLIVPLNLLAGVIYIFLPTLANMLWSISEHLLLWLHLGLDFSLSINVAGVNTWLYAPFGLKSVLLLAMVVMVLLLPKVLPKSLLLLPLSMLLMVMFFPNQKGGLYIEPLISENPKLKQTLITQTHANTTRRWLILADLGVKKLSDHYPQTLIDTLKTQGIHQLDGVIVQTPSGVFVPAVQSLAQQMPVHQYWQAGDHELKGGLRPQVCQAGKTWQKDGLQIRALTGWRQIADERAWGCELEIVSVQPLTLWADAMHSDSAMGELANDKPTQLIFSQSAHSMPWQLWQMLCDARANAPLALSQLPHHHRVWLSSTFAQHNEAVLQSYQAQQVLFLESEP